jgi:flagellar biosynthesis/type III secretory pathway chaperone
MMPTTKPASSQEALVSMLASAQATTTALADILDQEQRALISCDSLELAPLAKLKHDLLLRLEQWSQGLRAFVTELGYSPAAGAVAKWIEAQRHPKLNSLWQDVIRTTGEIRFKNEINGRLIATQLNHVELQCSTLCSTTIPRELYGADGASYRTSPSRTIAAA